MRTRQGRRKPTRREIDAGTDSLVDGEEERGCRDGERERRSKSEPQQGRARPVARSFLLRVLRALLPVAAPCLQREVGIGTRR